MAGAQTAHGRWTPTRRSRPRRRPKLRTARRSRNGDVAAVAAADIGARQELPE